MLSFMNLLIGAVTYLNNIDFMPFINYTITSSFCVYFSRSYKTTWRAFHLIHHLEKSLKGKQSVAGKIT